MKFTVINSETGAPFIQQQYDTNEEAEARLEALRTKVGAEYPLAVSVVDEDEDEKPQKEEKTAGPTQPLSRPRATPRR